MSFSFSAEFFKECGKFNMNAGVALRQMNVSTICVGQPSTKLDKQIFLDDCGEETTVLVSH